MFVSSNKCVLDELAAVVASVLNGVSPAVATVKLAQAPFTPVQGSDPASFTEATFDGYASKTVTAWETPYLVTGGIAETISTTLLHWAPTGTTTPNIIAGYWVVGGNGDYLGGEVFPAPIPMNGPTTVINLMPIWQIPPALFSGLVIN